MSVIVKNMEMPSGCQSCDFSDDETRFCKAAKEYIPMLGKPEFCPLVELLDKHGRLIDADDMERFMSDTVQGNIRQYPYSDTTWDMAFKWIDSRPTIVEAEGE